MRVTNEAGEQMVVMSLSEFNAFQEELELLRDREYALRARLEMKASDLVPWEEIIREFKSSDDPRTVEPRR